ncbi:MAG: hypothetical protein ABI863_18095 [Ginsengibacter sp.]
MPWKEMTIKGTYSTVEENGILAIDGVMGNIQQIIMPDVANGISSVVIKLQ